jgi:hypothetical protein
MTPIQEEFIRLAQYPGNEVTGTSPHTVCVAGRRYPRVMVNAISNKCPKLRINEIYKKKQ